MSNLRLSLELKRIESHFRQSLHEYAHIFTRSGVEETRLKGSKDKVPVPWTVAAFDRILTHNHPSDTPILSDKDCHLILCRGLREIRCYTLTQGGMLLRVPDYQTPTERKTLDYKKDIKKLWGSAALKKYGISGPALVAKLYGLEMEIIPPMEAL